MHPAGVDGRLIEGDGIHHPFTVAQHQLQVAFPHHALRHHVELAVERRFFEALPPWVVRRDQGRVGDGEIRVVQLTIGELGAAQGLRRDARVHRIAQRFAEAFQVNATNREAGRHRVATELFHEAREPGAHIGQCIADVEPLDGAGGTLELPWCRVAGVRKGDGRPVEALAHAAGDDADHALMPTGVIDADRAAALLGGRHQRLGVLRHHLLDATPHDVQLVKAGGQGAGFGQVGSQQALDADAHVLQAAGGVQARRQGEPQVRGAQARRRTPSHFHECGQARPRPAAAHSAQAVVCQDAVVAVQRHDVGDGAQGDEIEPMRQVGPFDAALGEEAQRGEPGAQPRAHVPNDPHAGQRLAREPAARRVRVDDGARRRQLGARQVMVRHDHVHAGVLRQRHAGHARDAIIDGDDDRWRPRHGDGGEFRRQAVAMLEAIRHEVIHAARAQGAQEGDSKGGAGGAIGVEVPHHQHRLVFHHGARQALRRRVDAIQGIRSFQAPQREVEIGR